jgi:DNA mismatch repair protein MutL
MMDFDSDARLEIPVLGSGGGGGYTALREPAQVRDRGYNPFRYEGDLSRFGGDYGAEEKAATSGFTDYPSGEEEQATHFEYISSSSLASAAKEDEDAPRRQGRMTGLDGPKSFSAAVNIGEGYAAALYGGVFVAVDLRRAREAVLFDRLRVMVGSGRSATQKLLFPERMALSADDAALLKDHAEEFSALGFDIRQTGTHAVEIHGTPADMPSEAMDEVVYGMLDELRDGVFEGETARRERLAAVMARAGAGTASAAARLPAAEIASLLEALASTANPSFTPQGKAVMAAIALDEIRNRFK